MQVQWGEQKKKITIMGNPLFNINLGNYRALVEIIHNSNQVTRYKIKLRDKSFVLEEYLLKKSDKWKLKEYTDNVNVDKLVNVLSTIIDGITAYMNPKPPTNKKSW